MKRKIFISIFILLLILTPTAFADEVLNLVVDTVPVAYTDAYPFIENGRTMIPLRILTENMQAEISYDEASKTVTIKRNGNCTTKATYGSDDWNYIEYKGKKYENAVAVCVFTENSKDVTIELIQDGKTIHSTKSTMDVPAKIINGRTYIPARYVAYALGYGVYYDQPRNRILYTYKANQIADFEEKIKYNKEYYQYSDSRWAGREPVTNYKSWAYRDGYGSIKIVDGDNGWELYKAGGSTERSHEMSELLYMPAGYTFETNEYPSLSHQNTFEENLKIFQEMINNKTQGVMTRTGENYYSIYINTYKELVGVSYANGKYIIGPQKDKDFRESPMAGPPQFGRYDFSKFYYIDEGKKFYYNSSAGGSAVYHNSSTYNLLFLRTFLGEIGDRIWQMMDDYYMHNGVFDRGEVYVGESVHSMHNFLDTEIMGEHVSNYGFEFISSVNNVTNAEQYKRLTLKYGNFEFEISYKRNGLCEPQVGYKVYFENLPADI